MLQLPLVPTVLLSLSVMVAQNLTHISEALLVRHLRTRSTLTYISLSLSPVQLRIKGLRLVDANARPLLTANELNVHMSRKKVLHCNIVANGLVLHADINPVDWQDSNWSAHLSNIRQQKVHDLQTVDQPRRDERKGEWDVHVPRSTLVLSIAAQHATIRTNQPSITLPLPPLVITSADLSSISAIDHLVNGILGKAARDAGSNSFPREFRTGARRAARIVADVAVDKLFANANTRIRRWRRKVDQMGNYLDGIPDSDDVQGTMKNLGAILRKLENLLSSAGRTEVKDSRVREQEGASSYEMHEIDELDVKD